MFAYFISPFDLINK
ncbi:hypothetical protein [Leptotrichia massiliensis]